MCILELSDHALLLVQIYDPQAGLYFTAPGLDIRCPNPTLHAARFLSVPL